MKPICLMLVPAFMLSFATTDAGAQSWPTKPLRAIVPFAAGSSTDIIPRIVFEQLSSQLGQTIVVENRTGAGGTIGAAFVAKSEPDGYTILVSGSAHTIAPALYPKLTYHPGRDFAAVVPLGISPNVLVVSPAKGFKTVSDLVAAAKSQARHVQLLFGWNWERDPSECGAVPVQRRNQRRTCSVQRRRRGYVGGDRRACRLLLWPARAGAAACPRGQAHGAGREWRQPHAGFAGRSDDAGGRLQRRGVPDLVRAVCPGKNTTRHRRQAAQRDGQSAASTQGAGADSLRSSSIPWS